MKTLVQKQTGWQRFKSRWLPATKHDLEEMEKHIMSAIENWATKIGPKLDSIQTGLDAVQKLVEELQNGPGTFTPADQILVDQIEAKIDAIAGDANSVPTPPVVAKKK